MYDIEHDGKDLFKTLDIILEAQIFFLPKLEISGKYRATGAQLIAMRPSGLVSN